VIKHGAGFSTKSESWGPKNTRGRWQIEAGLNMLGSLKGMLCFSAPFFVDDNLSLRFAASEWHPQISGKGEFHYENQDNFFGNLGEHIPINRQRRSSDGARSCVQCVRTRRE
jgi:hypothetical protein